MAHTAPSDLSAPARPPSRRARRLGALAVAVMAAVPLLGPGTSAQARAATPSPQPRVAAGTYVNPVSRGFADTFADPSLIRGKDGFWYAYGTSDPLREGETRPRRIPIARSSDLVTWRYVADAFTDATLPRWATPDAGIWAPDIRYVDGQYRMYYVVTSTTVTPEKNDNAIGMATAPSPAGPWTDSGAPVVGPRRGQGKVDDFLWSFDPSTVTDAGGRQWIFYGSYYGGIFVAPLSRDGRRVTASAKQVAIDNKFEGAYPVRHGGWWYLFASTANCCAGPTTGYSVQVGRSRSLTGPYVDRQGVPLTASRAGGTPVLNQNGNRWIGPGHNAVVTDLAGQDWIAYHAIDRADPYLNGTDGINQRPMLLDRLDWVDGWPAVNAGRGPSARPHRAPATSGVVTFSGSSAAQWRTAGAVTRARDAQSGALLRSTGPAVLLTRRPVPSARLEADVRTSGAAVTLLVGRKVALVVDPRRATARLVAGNRSSTVRLPAGWRPGAWHSLSLQVQGGRAVAELSNARLNDPLVHLTLPVSRSAEAARPAAVIARGRGVDVDNVSARPAARPVTALARDVVPHRLDRAASDEFTGTALAPGWSWVRQDAAATVSGGALRWPVERADLVGTGNDAGVLLRSLGSGPWTAETKLTIDLGVTDIRNFQQAGIIAYAGDDLFARLSHVAIFDTRQTEFGNERPYAGRLSYGGTIIGPPATTTWLRLTHRVDPANGEHELRGWTSRDGRTWVKGGVWTLPAGSNVRIGLVSMGSTGGPSATASFDYLRVYR